MNPNRYFHLRNSKQFSPEQFERFRQNCVTWELFVFEELCNWSSDFLHMKYPVPQYEFGKSELSSDGFVATLPIGGEPDYVGVKTFEDYYPSELWQWFSLEFTRSFELGYTFSGTFDKPDWRQLSDEEINEFSQGDYLYGRGNWFNDPLKKIEGLSEEELFKLPFPQARCILWHVGHIAYQERYYLNTCLNGHKVKAPEKYRVFAKENISVEEIRQSIDSVKNVFEWIRETSQQREEYFTTIDSQKLLSVPSTSKEGLSIAHWLYILATHTSTHTRQVDILYTLIKETHS